MAGCKWCTWVVDKDDQDWYYDKLWALGSRLYRHRIEESKAHLKALAEIYKSTAR